MREKTINILIADSSYFVNNGLSELLEKSINKIKIEIVYSLIEMTKLKDKGYNFDIIIINPSFIQYNRKEFSSLKKIYNSTIWIGLIYSFYNKEITEQFDSLIYVDDLPEVVIKTINTVSDRKKDSLKNFKKEYLTDREIEVLKLLTEGNSNKEIAYKLKISTHTVITHRKNISHKTGIKTVSGLTLFAVINKIINI